MRIRRRYLTVAAGLLMLAAPLSVAAQDTEWNGYFHGGDFSVGAGVGATFGFFGGGLALYPAVEWTILDIDPGLPLAFGASARGFVSFSQYLNQSWTVFGGGGFATAHLGLDLDVLPDFFRKMDVYVGLGLAFTVAPVGFFNAGGLGFATFEGVNYFVNDSLAVYLEYVYWSYANGATIGVLLKL
jgi:hypothetical protein